MAKKKKKRHNALLDYYRILGVSPAASQKAIQKAFWNLAQDYHPDVNFDPEATEKFKIFVEAYQALKAEDSRDDYDAEVLAEFCRSFILSLDDTSQKSVAKPRELPVVLRVLKKGF